ncbi:MAG TPA: serine/threonine-protein kinase, partial [Kofleriaceae bacterium]
MAVREPDEVSAEVETQSQPPTFAEDSGDRDERVLAGLQPGAHIRHYELIRKVGEGGMGAVFLARDLKLGRLVAMKFVTTRSSDAARRFVAEARATAACHHENIVVVHEVDAHFGTPFMVLEYVEGRTLREEVGGSAIPPARAVELIVPVVKAMICAHDLGIVHRDLKMGNILVSTSGVVKVLDFGVAKVLTENSGIGVAPIRPARVMPARVMPKRSDLDEPTSVFPEGSPSGTEALQVGTPTYMAPEQFATGAIDHRADIFALGIVMFRMLTGRHPVENPTTAALVFAAGDIDSPFPSVREFAPHLPATLVQIVDRCVAKQPDRRFPDARSLLAELEPLLPSRGGRRLAQGECPFPGLSSFQEADADRFFGRDRDTLRAVTRLRELPLIAVVGPSGVGKSSFVRAGVIPALKASGESWTTFAFRPGRTPLATLAMQLATVMTLAPDFTERLRSEPGVLGSALREYARATRTKLLVFVDQFEELYTLVADPVERQAVTAALAGVADDAASPVRVVLSLRSDFIDRVDEDRRFADELVRGIVLLSPPSRDEMREVLTLPLAMVDARFESDQIVDEMIGVLGSTAGALPLLQFTASRLWDARDVATRTLTRHAYDAIGGVAGA